MSMQNTRERGRTLYIVVPCYNEEEVLPETCRRLSEKLSSLIDSGAVSEKSRICFVNDGSKDGTWELIERYFRENPLVCGLDLSRNRGHQNALLAGLMSVRELCDMTVSMDADLQDDVDALDAFVEQYHQGCEVVCGVRSSRESDSFFKRTTAQGFYRIMSAMGVDLVYNHADYRLLSSTALRELADYREVNLFLRGVIPLIGFKSGTVEYERHERFAGESKYPLKKMLALAFDGVSSFSIRPIRFISVLGALIFTVSLLMLVYFLAIHLAGRTVQGWTTVVMSVWVLGGLQLLAIGVIGEYIGKIYMEAKARPRWAVREFLKK